MSAPSRTPAPIRRRSPSLNGKAALSVAIRKQSGVNTVALADAIRARMAEITKTLPPTFEVRLIRDDSEFIRASLAAIEEHLILGGFLAAVIVFIFLRNFRSTLIAAVAIPASIIGAFGVMSALNFTINQMTMLALTLMVGIVIDDAIVVLENIYRFVEEKGMTPRRAAVEGTKEIGLAVMATTMSLLAVFLPVGFLGGIIGRFMSSFGLTSAAAIAISLIVSFTLTPMLASRWIKHDHDERASDHSRRGFYRHIDRVYTRMLEFSMAHRWVIVGICALVIASLLPLFRASGINFTPQEDESRFQIQVRLPVGSSLAATHVADGADRPRHPRAAAGRDRHAVLPRRRRRRLRPDQRRQPVRPPEADRRARVQAAGADRAGAAARPALPPVGGDLHPGGGRARRAERPRRADSVRPGRTGPAEARPVHRTRPAAALQERHRSSTSTAPICPAGRSCG